MIPKFKIRASAVGQIMTNGKDAAGLTDKQGERLAELCAKEKPTKGQLEQIVTLTTKRDKPPELSATAKTYCKTWLKEKLYNRRKDIKSKYLDKGNACESKSLTLINAQTMEEYELNTEYKENDYLTGTCDIQGDDVIRDIKNSWSPDTFPLFDTGIKDKGYWWQLQAYMELYDKSKAWLDYTLIDAPFHLIKKEANNIAYSEGLDFDTIFPDVLAAMTFEDVDQHLKHKCFEISRDRSAMEDVKKRVIMCREYIEQLQKSI